MRLTAVAAAAAICCTIPNLAYAQPKKSATTPNKTAREKELKELRLESRIAKARLEKKLRGTKEQQVELQAKYNLMKKQAEMKLASLELEKKRLATQNAVEKARYQATQTKADLALAARVAKLKREKAQLDAKYDLVAEKMRKDELQQRAERNRITAAINKLKLRNMRLKQEQTELRHKVTRYNYALQWRQKRQQWRAQANTDPVYLNKPYDPRTHRLTISDRRIPLNGPIISGVGAYVTSRIHYYNNIDPKKPIFIVIDNCPGGSVMEGYRIVKAMQSSHAPVHVVVKSFAASMAAVITTLAKESYAYPNAIILHHQMSTWNRGNITQLGEQLKVAHEWERRLMGPVARKIGMSINQFRINMYKHNSNGDWEEFADKAHRLKWVTHLVNEIRETGIVKKPNKPVRRFFFFGLKEQTDANGRRYIRLPRLRPYDMYFIHNSDHYYR